jgi:ankyrin repeat domain-containing protein 50
MCLPNHSLADILIKSRFRWVALQLDAVSRCNSLAALRFALSSLPPSLDETYRRILESIDVAEQPHVQRILQWLCFSKRLLCVEEIAVIYEVGDNIQSLFAPDDGPFHLDNVTDVCRGLLSLSLHQSDGSELRYDDKSRSFSQSSTIQITQLAHFSVKEYLLSLQGFWATVDQTLSEVTILKSAITCYLHFLSHDATPLSPSDVLQYEQYSIAQYFVEYFSDHLASVKEHPDLFPSLQLLLHPSSTLFHDNEGWCLVAPYDTRRNKRSWDPALNLLFAAHLGLTQICRYLFEMNVHPILTESIIWLISHSTVWSYGTILYPRIGAPPLIKAARCGDVELMQVLLDARADHHYSGDDPLADGSALEEATSRGDIQIVQMLLEAGDNISEATGRFGRSLFLAIERGYKEILIALISAGAAVNNNDGKLLVFASSRGREDLVQILLDAGADANSENGWAIHFASSTPNEGMLRMLIKAGANVDLKGDTGETALQLALRLGHERIVHLLIEAGASDGS